MTKDYNKGDIIVFPAIKTIYLGIQQYGMVNNGFLILNRNLCFLLLVIDLQNIKYLDMRKTYKYLKWLFGLLLYYAIWYIVIYVVNMSMPE